MRKTKAIPKKGKSAFAFVVDGECEYWYILMLKRNERSLNVDLKPEIPQKKKLIDQYKLVIELANDYDKVYWIIDFDTINKETREAKKGTEPAIQELKKYCAEIEKSYVNIIVIVNNPCLEYWYLLHYEPTSKYYENCNAVINQLKKHLAGYDKTQSFYTKQGNDIYLRLKSRLSTAISNAEKLGKFDFQNPETGMSEMQLFYNMEEIKKVIEAK